MEPTPFQVTRASLEAFAEPYGGIAFLFEGLIAMLPFDPDALPEPLVIMRRALAEPGACTLRIGIELEGRDVSRAWVLRVTE